MCFGTLAKEGSRDVGGVTRASVEAWHCGARRRSAFRDVEPVTHAA